MFNILFYFIFSSVDLSKFSTFWKKKLIFLCHKIEKRKPYLWEENPS